MTIFFLIRTPGYLSSPSPSKRHGYHRGTLHLNGSTGLKWSEKEVGWLCLNDEKDFRNSFYEVFYLIVGAVELTAYCRVIFPSFIWRRLISGCLYSQGYVYYTVEGHFCYVLSKQKAKYERARKHVRAGRHWQVTLVACLCWIDSGDNTLTSVWRPALPKVREEKNRSWRRRADKKVDGKLVWKLQLVSCLLFSTCSCITCALLNMWKMTKTPRPVASGGS